MSSPQSKIALQSSRVVTVDGIKEAIVLVDDGVIVAIVPPDERPNDYQIDDLGKLVLMPGLVDCHVHVNEPGRTHWEGFETATRAAAAGGITTIADMPLNSDPVTTTVEALKIKMDSMQGQLWVDCALWGGVIPGNAPELNQMIDMGVSGFKCFLIHSGIDDFPNVTESDLRIAMPILARRGVPLLVHAEMECGEPHKWDHEPHSYSSFLKSRPRRWENEAIELMIKLCREFKCPVHIVHLSSADAIPLIQKAKQEGLPFTAETCPHYLTFCSEEIADGDPRFKCAPPIRERENRERLWAAVQDGTIEFVVSDHSPCSPDLKYLSEGDLSKAWGGISSLQFGLSTIWTEASKRGATILDLTRWMCEKPAHFLRLDKMKGAIKVGYDADFVIWNPEDSHTIHHSRIHHKHKVTPYDGRKLFGEVKQTYVRGHKVFDQSKHATKPIGQHILTAHSESRR